MGVLVTKLIKSECLTTLSHGMLAVFFLFLLYFHVKLFIFYLFILKFHPVTKERD